MPTQSSATFRWLSQVRNKKIYLYVAFDYTLVVNLQGKGKILNFIGESCMWPRIKFIKTDLDSELIWVDGKSFGLAIVK